MKEPLYTFAQWYDNGIGMLRQGTRKGHLNALYALNDDLEDCLAALRRLPDKGVNSDELIPGIKFALDLIAEHRRKLVRDESNNKGEQKNYPLPLPPKTAENTETAPLSRPMKFKGEQK